MILTGALLIVVGQCAPYTRTLADGSPQARALHWPELTQIVWHPSAPGNPETMGTEFAAIDKAIATWQAQLTNCGSLTLTTGARTVSRHVGDNDGQNVILWRLKLCSDTVASTDPCFGDESCGNKYDCWDKAREALAITVTSYETATGRILDTDIELNTPLFTFTTVDAPPCLKPNYSQACVASDVQNTVTHELGHTLGLGHNCVATSTMFGNAAPGELSKRVLDEGSKRFICDTYPKNGPSTSWSLFTVDPALGKSQTGCGVAPGALWGAVALLGLVRRRASPLASPAAQSENVGSHA